MIENKCTLYCNIVYVCKLFSLNLGLVILDWVMSLMKNVSAEFSSVVGFIHLLAIDMSVV